MSALLDLPEAARLMGRCRTTVWRWAHNGQIPAAAVVKFGRVVRLRRDALVAAGFLSAPPTIQEGRCDVG